MVNHRDQGGVTPLISAACYGNADAIQALLDAGADRFAEDDGGYTALVAAASKDAVPCLKVLLEYFPKGSVPLTSAEVAAMVNHRCKKGWTSLMHAADNNNADAIQALLDAGADRFAEVAENGDSALLLAARCTRFKCMQLLLEYAPKSCAPLNPADVSAMANKRRQDGSTALGDAICLMDRACAGILVAAGANALSPQDLSRMSRSHNFCFGLVTVLDPNKADDVMLAIIIAAASSEYKNTKLLNNRMSIISSRAELQEWFSLPVDRVSSPGVSLSRLDLSDLKWPSVVPAMTRMRFIDLSRCKLKKVPSVLQSSTLLMELQLQDNPIKELPDWLSPAGALPALTYLDVSSTNIKTLPVAFSRLKTIRAFSCNRLVPHYKTQADSADKDALLRYLHQCAQGEMQPLLQVTVTLLGPVNVGKSRILECMTKSKPRFFGRKVLKKHRSRTLFPVIKAYTFRSKSVPEPLHVVFTDPPGDAQLAPAVQFFVSAENSVFLVVINGAGLHQDFDQAATSGNTCEAEKVARSWLSYVSDQVFSRHQSCRSILVATHRDTAEKNKTFDQDSKRLAELCLELQAAYPAAKLRTEPVFINALDRKEGRSTLWSRVLGGAAWLLKGQMVPKFINTCSDFMEQYTSISSTAQWCSYEEFVALPMVKDLTRDQRSSAFASLRKMGYVILLPNGTIIMKPQWFAAAASLTLSPPKGPNDGDAPLLHIQTDPNNPGFVTDGSLKKQILSLTAGFKELEWSDDAKTRDDQVSKLVEFLAYIETVIPDPLERGGDNISAIDSNADCKWFLPALLPHLPLQAVLDAVPKSPDLQCYALRYRRWRRHWRPHEIHIEIEDDFIQLPTSRPSAWSMSSRNRSTTQDLASMRSDSVAASSQLHRSSQSSESMTHPDGSTLHFPPGFVLQLPLVMVQLSSKLGIEFVSVRFGKYSVQLIMSDALHLFIEVEDHGSRLDFIALYKHNDAEARQWLPQVVRVFELAVRLQLWRSGCPLASLETDGAVPGTSYVQDDQRKSVVIRQEEDSKVDNPAASAQAGNVAVSGAAPLVCCHFHHPTSPDLLDCEAIPLCGQCLLATGHHREVVMIARAPSMQLPSAASSPAASVRRCKRVGHSVSAETMCFDRWCDTASSSTSTSNALPAPHPATAAAVKEVLDDPPELVRRLSFLCKEVKLVNEQLAFVKSKQNEHVEAVADQLSQVRARQDDQSALHEALSQRVVKLEQRFEGFDDSLKDALDQLDQGFKEVESKMSALQDTAQASEQSASEDRVRLQSSLNDIKGQIARLETRVADDQLGVSNDSNRNDGDQKSCAVDQSAHPSSQQVAELLQKQNELERKLRALQKQCDEHDWEQAKLHPFFRIVQRPEIQQQLRQLTANPGKQCAVFYNSLKVYLVSYLLNTKLLADKVLLDRSAETISRITRGLATVLEAVAEVAPFGGAAAALTKGALFAAKSLLGVREDQIKDRTESKLVESQNEFLSVFRVSEAEDLAQLLALTVTKCYELQLHKLTVDACKELAKAAVTRIAMSLSTALDEITSSHVHHCIGATGASSGAISSDGKSIAQADKESAALDRLCDLFLRALRVPFEERQFLFWTKVKFSTVDPQRHSDWNADGVFSKCGLVVAVTPPVPVFAPSREAATPLPLPAASQGVKPDQSVLSVLAAPLLSDVLRKADESQVQQLLAFYQSTDSAGKHAASCRPDKYGYSLGTARVAALGSLDLQQGSAGVLMQWHGQ